VLKIARHRFNIYARPQLKTYHGGGNILRRSKHMFDGGQKYNKLNNNSENFRGQSC